MEKIYGKRQRSHTCGDLSEENVGDEVILMGWVQSYRNLGGCVFVDLRDREGVTQIVFDPGDNADTHSEAAKLRSEWVVAIRGMVRSRGDNVNTHLKTGAIEVVAHGLEILARAKTPPFVIADDVDASDELRFRYRYLDLRRPVLQKNLIDRHRFNQVVRSTLDEDGFLELETPFLIKSTPEGARDYVVPSRVHAGQFFALPQSPQLFKQLFMVSGYDRYFQIARCFRDEDLRAERQPEFTQVDIEMSFSSQEDVQSVVEVLMQRVWRELRGIELKVPFERIAYDDAMARFGVDAPDLRFGLELVDCTDLAATSGFRVFSQVAGDGGSVKGINLRDAGAFSRKELDELGSYVQVFGAKGLAWVRVQEGGEWQGPIAKFFDAEARRAMAERLSLAPHDVAVFVADKLAVTNAALGNLRKHVAKKRDLIPADSYRFCWVTDFPLFEWDDESERFYAAHHPFTSPRLEDRPLLDSDPGAVKALAYDIALNGIEIGGGSIRIHDSELQQEMFAALGIGEQEAREKFGFLLDALQYGAPPHGGIALGVDRIMMLLCGTSSIRDVIAFPKTQRQTDLMLDAPSPLDGTQLEELSIDLVAKQKATEGDDA